MLIAILGLFPEKGWSSLPSRQKHLWHCLVLHAPEVQDNVMFTLIKTNRNGHKISAECGKLKSWHNLYLFSPPRGPSLLIRTAKCNSINDFEETIQKCSLFSPFKQSLYLRPLSNSRFSRAAVQNSSAFIQTPDNTASEAVCVKHTPALNAWGISVSSPPLPRPVALLCCICWGLAILSWKSKKHSSGQNLGHLWSREARGMRVAVTAIGFRHMLVKYEPLRVDWSYWLNWSISWWACAALTNVSEAHSRKTDNTRNTEEATTYRSWDGVLYKSLFNHVVYVASWSRLHTMWLWHPRLISALKPLLHVTHFALSPCFPSFLYCQTLIEAKRPKIEMLLFKRPATPECGIHEALSSRQC